MRIKTYLVYWFKNAGFTLQALLATRLASLLFILGKFIRFAFFWWFLIILGGRINLVAGYSFNQLVMFYLIYNLFDLAGQFFYRGTYWFREAIISGSFDFNLVKPLNPLFQILTDHTDFLDVPLLIVVVGAIVWRLPTVSGTDLLVFGLLSATAMIVLTAIHIAVVSIGVMTTEVDHTIWIFRDLAAMARMPINIYAELIRTVLTYVIPVALVFTFPAQGLLGLLKPSNVLLILLASLLSYWLALRFWQFALTRYSSASS